MHEKQPAPEITLISCNMDQLDVRKDMTDAQLKLALEQTGYPFAHTFKAKSCYIHRKVADSDVLISVGENIANFNGYIELNASAAFLWELLQKPCTCGQLEQKLEDTFAISHERAVEDVLDFLKELQEHNMVEVC